MNTAKLILMLVLVLLVGVFAGSLGTRLYLKHEIERSEAGRHDPEERVKRIVGRLTDELKLDNNQQAEVRKVVMATDARVTGIKASYEPELKRIYDQSFQRIGDNLKDEQRVKLQKRRDRFSAKYNAMYFRSLRIAQAGLPDGETIARRLGLNGSQRPQVDAILKVHREREGRVIEKYEKTGRPDLTAVDREIAEVRSTSMKDLSRVMTGEQLDRFRKDIACWSIEMRLQ